MNYSNGQCCGGDAGLAGTTNYCGCGCQYPVVPGANPALQTWNGQNFVVADGSYQLPIYLPNLQQFDPTQVSNVIGMSATGQLVRFADVQYAPNNALVTATGSTTPRTLANRFADVVNVKDFGATGDGTTDDAGSIQAAINYCFSNGGGAVFLPKGNYKTLSTLIFKNNIVYYGEGQSSTLITYSGTSDAVQVNNPSNSSTYANISVRDIGIICTIRTNKKSSFADNGSALLTFHNVTMYGNDHGLILDQSELVDVTECYFSVVNGGTSCVWLVNGPDRTAGNSFGYTNRISFRSCYFDKTINSSYTNGLFGVIDDGGISHVFSACNFEGPATAMRFCGGNGITVNDQCEIEGNTTQVFLMSSSTYYNTSGATLQNININIEECNILSGSINLVTFGTGSVRDFAFSKNSIMSDVGNGLFANSGAGVSNWFGFSNTQFGAGYSTDSILGNYFSTLTITSSTGTLTVNGSQGIFPNSLSGTATAGTNGTLPAQVAGYAVVNIGGTNYKVPYYNV